MTKHPLPGSERKLAPGSKVVAQCDPSEAIQVMVVLRRKDEQQFDQLMKKIEAGAADATPLTREELEQRFGASADDVAKLKAFASQHGLAVVREDASARTVVLGGSIDQFQKAFDVQLHDYEHHSMGRFRGRTGAISLPDDLHGVVKAVLGLDDRPQARPHFRIRPPFQAARVQQRSFTPLQLASLYHFPQGDGSGQCIGIIELGGGYRKADLDSYFSSLGVQAPKVVAVGVDTGGNHPTGDPNGPDGEVTLDVEIAGAIAPGASIAVYFTINSDAGFIDAVSRAVHDTANKPSVISISWGAPESVWTAQSMNAFNDVLRSAAAIGVTVCAASGDSGSNDGVSDGGDHVDFPASSPYVLACGGTSLQGSGQTVTHEVVWNDGANGGASGGGVSGTFAVPAWQEGLSASGVQGAKRALTGRGVPDVAGDASPLTGYDVIVDGSNTVVGGTSAVAPLWAALIARINGAKGAPVGFVNPKLYKAAGACNDITQGNNGSYAATAGWDACTGLGSPNGAKVAAAL
jgi:kumamolisin